MEISNKNVADKFRLDGKVAVITGGSGLLGNKHADAISEMGGIPVIIDIDQHKIDETVQRIKDTYSVEVMGCMCDITDKDSVRSMVARITEHFGKIDILINNASFSVKGRIPEGMFAPIEEYPLDLWEMALKVNLTGTFLITQAVGKIMVKQKRGAIVIVASDVGIISPDHRIYKGLGTGPDKIPFNTPIWYSTSKAALINFTRHLATHWAKHNIRVNSVSPAGVYDKHDPEFVARLSNLIPLGRMAHKDEYKGAIVFLVSDASSFMTGSNLIIDGGRTCW